MAKTNSGKAYEDLYGSCASDKIAKALNGITAAEAQSAGDKSAETKPDETVTRVEEQGERQAPEKLSLPQASFEESVEEFEISGIKPSFTGKKAPIINGMFIVRMFLLVACASMFMYCVYSIAERVADSLKNQSIIDNLIDSTEQKSAVQKMAQINNSPSALCLYDALGVTEYEAEYVKIDTAGKYDAIRYTIMKLKEENSDVYGWIRCKGGMTNINYPIVKSNDNSYYLTRNIYKDGSARGSIFADFRNSFTHSDNYNTIFYGHCMHDGSMFRAVKDWYDNVTFRDEAADQISIEIITPDAVYIYEIFAAYRSTGADFITVSFANNTAYLSFLNSIQKKSVLNRDIHYDANSRIITLSTCTNVPSSPDERYVVHGILTKIIKYS